MINVELKYPLNLEVMEFHLPLPNVYVVSDDSVAFIFTDEKEYFGYLESLCDLTDKLFYEAIKTEQTRHKLTCLTNLVSLFNR
jgi:hypothetical protein